MAEVEPVPGLVNAFGVRAPDGHQQELLVLSERSAPESLLLEGMRLSEAENEKSLG